jgi:hypothetical protein
MSLEIKEDIPAEEGESTKSTRPQGPPTARELLCVAVCIVSVFVVSTTLFFVLGKLAETRVSHARDPAWIVADVRRDCNRTNCTGIVCADIHTNSTCSIDWNCSWTSMFTVESCNATLQEARDSAAAGPPTDSSGDYEAPVHLAFVVMIISGSMILLTGCFRSCKCIISK